MPAPLADGIELFYAGRFAEQADPTFDFLAVGSTATTDNVTNYIHGITGIRVFFSDIVQFATTPDAAFIFEWTTAMGTTFSAVTGAGTAISVTAAVQGDVTVATIIVDDDHIRNRHTRRDMLEIVIVVFNCRFNLA